MKSNTIRTSTIEIDINKEIRINYRDNLEIDLIK
jgi:hypothetical protein